MTSEYSLRRQRFLELLAGRKADAAAVSVLPNIRYLSGFMGSNAVLWLTARRMTLFTDPRYAIQASRECDCEVEVLSGPLWPAIWKRARKLRWLALEAASLPHSRWQEIRTALPGVLLRDCSGLAEELRMVKSPAEVVCIRASVLLNSRAYESVLGRIRPDWTEQRVAAELDHRMRLLGAAGPAFETIVAAGPNSALPHARPGNERIGTNRLLLIDMGASLDGYASDMTRVVHMGSPSPTARRLYDAVLEAQLASIDAVRPGTTAAEVDQAGRKLLQKRKLDHLFTHSTGHGLGLEIHEEPRLGRKSSTVLKPGMVVTIEPGVYREGFGGVRIEDTVLVTETGVEVLTPTKKDLLSIP